MRKLFILASLLTGFLFSIHVNAQYTYGPPPRNLQFDSLTLVATWDPPLGTVLDEHFEGVNFPPPLWQDSTQGMGWFATTDGSSAGFTIPGFSSNYAVVNNELAGSGNNGCCDYLITPEMDLTQYEGYSLSFYSYFRGADAETASVEISTDGGNTWTILLDVLPHFYWARINIDLSAYSGATGSQHVKIAFKASDNSNTNATGWAIDDVTVLSGSVQLYGYYVFLGGAAVAYVTETTFTFNSSYFQYGDTNVICIAADYGFEYGMVCNSATSYFLPPPQNLEAFPNASNTGVAVILTWEPPLSGDAAVANGEAVADYNIYRNDLLIANISNTDSIYWDLNLIPDTYCYNITAVYDLTNFGFPGQIGESVKEGPACADALIYVTMPFTEDWNTGQFDSNHWAVGDNWEMDATNGNPPAAAKFASQPKQTNYSSSLVSFFIGGVGSNTSTPYCVWLDFDYLLDDNSASGTEKLTIEVADRDSWTNVKQLLNYGDIGWTTEHINISSFVKNNLFRVRFNANGTDSELINSWLIDNIHMYTEYGFAPPLNLTAINTGNSQQNDIQVAWQVPQWEQFAGLILDDSTWENTTTINPGYSGWLGNKFTFAEGKIRSADILWHENANSSHNTLFLDVFDSNHTLVGSSGEFIPTLGVWQSIGLPDVPVAGDFYLMVRFENQSGVTDLLEIDSTTLSGRPNSGWFYDGNIWLQMSALGFDECAFSIRATIRMQADCEVADIIGHSAGNYEKKNEAALKSSHNSTKSTTSNSGLVNYEVYRREYRVPLPGQDSILTEWLKIADVTGTNYLDENLDIKCYQYYSSAMYIEGSSANSNIDEACFQVGVNDPKANGFRLYPNPADNTVNLEFSNELESLTIINAVGQEIYSTNITNQSTIRINTSLYLSGIYYIRFITAKGDSFIRKLVVVH